MFSQRFKQVMKNFLLFYEKLMSNLVSTLFFPSETELRLFWPLTWRTSLTEASGPPAASSCLWTCVAKPTTSSARTPGFSLTCCHWWERKQNKQARVHTHMCIVHSTLAVHTHIDGKTSFVLVLLYCWLCHLTSSFVPITGIGLLFVTLFSFTPARAKITRYANQEHS